MSKRKRLINLSNKFEGTPFRMTKIGHRELPTTDGGYGYSFRIIRPKTGLFCMFFSHTPSNHIFILISKTI